MGIGSIGGIGGYAQPYTTPLSSGPAAAQKPTTPVETAQEDEAERTRRTQQAQNTTTQGASGGNTTATRGQNLNITV